MAGERKTKRRSVIQASGNRRRQVTTYIKSSKFTSIQPATFHPYSILGRQTTISEGHPFHSRARKGTQLTDIGGDFYTQKQYVIAPKGHRVLNPAVETSSSIVTTNYQGPLVAAFPDASAGSPSYPPGNISTGTEMNVWGAQAIAACKPTNSVADAATFLGELYKEGLPNLIGQQLWKDRTNVVRLAKAKGTADEYLNTHFGWMPLLREVTAFAEAVRNADRVLAQYERDAGRMVRRRYHFPPEVTKETLPTRIDVMPFGPVGSGISQSPGVLSGRRETRRERWFSGAFTYQLPFGYVTRSRMSKYAGYADRIGLHLTPETLWNLAPWSWAVDWFSSAGAVISTMSDYVTDGLVMRYGYLMEHTIVSDVYSLEGYTMVDGSKPRVAHVTFVTETKQRKRASPYGFGVNWEGLTSFQLSILASLGITRSS